MPDLSRRQILTGLLAAPVAVPAAAAFGASNSLGNKLPPLTAERWFIAPKIEPWVIELPAAEPVFGTVGPAWEFTLDKPVAPCPLVAIDASGADETPALEVDFAAAYGPHADPLDEDAATYCAVA